MEAPLISGKRSERLDSCKQNDTFFALNRKKGTLKTPSKLYWSTALRSLKRFDLHLST